MAAAAPQSYERAAVAAILTAAAVMAAWILLHRSPPTPLRVVQPHQSETKAVQPAADSAPPESLAIELVELPAPTPPPPVAAPTPVALVSAAPAPAPVAHVEKPPPEQHVEAPPQTVAPPPIVPLKPSAEPDGLRVATNPAAVTPLQPEATARAEIIPLTPMPEKSPPPTVQSAVKPIAPLMPGDEKVSPRPAPPKPLLYVEETRPAPPKPAVRPPESKSEPVKIAPPAPPPVERVVAKAEPSPASPKLVTEKEVATEGRVLLRMFEQGAGPSIEIRWPSQSGQRDKLYDVFVQCLGMRVGILDDQGHLYLGEGTPNQPLALNTDKYSGFVRRPEGAIAADEQREITRIRAYHTSAAAAPPARMFPRRVDAFLIGGLRQAVGDQYLKMKSIRAAYRLNGGQVVIESIVADGKPVDGAIDLSTVASCSNGSANE